FAGQVRRVPDAGAVSSGAFPLTYRQLDERANRLAHRLLEHGIRAETPVGVSLERSVDLVVATLAVVKAGACYVPLDAAVPPQRLQRIAEQDGISVLLVDGAAAAVPGLPPDVCVVEVGDDPAAPATDPGVVSAADQLAYVRYATGPDGDPRGIAVTHRDVVGLASDGGWDGGGHERVLMLAPYTSDVSQCEVWVRVLRGGHVVVPPPTGGGDLGALDVATLRRLLADEEITGLHLGAGAFRVVADRDPGCLAGLREVLTGGDPVAPTAVRRVREACPETVVRVRYGPDGARSFATVSRRSAAHQ